MDELWIIRHAESKGNAGHATSRPDSNSLTLKGHQQAAALAEKILAQPDYVEATTYFRTQQTAFPTLERFGLHRRPGYRVTAAFREMTYLNPAVWNGTTQDQRGLRAREYWDACDPDYNDGGGADSFNEIDREVRGGLIRLAQTSGKFGLLFSHGLIISLVTTITRDPGLTGSKLMRAFVEARRSGEVPNCAVLKLKNTGDGFAFVRPEQPLFNLIGNYTCPI